MKSRIKHTLLMTAAIATGLMAGIGSRHFSRSTPAGTAVGEIHQIARPASPVPQHAGDRQDLSHTLDGLLEEFRSCSDLPEEARKAIESMPTSSLRELAVSLYRTKASLKDAHAWQMWSALMPQIAEELYRRNPEDSLVWAESLGAEGSQIFGLILQKEIVSNPAAAAPWLMRHLDDLGQSWASEALSAAYAEAGTRDAETLLAIEAIYGTGRDRIFGLGKKPTVFAENFDYLTLIKGSKDRDMIDHTTTYWAAIKPREAMEKLDERMTIKPYLIGAVARGLSVSLGQEEAARWAAERLEPLEGEARQWAIDTLGTGMEPDPGQMAATMAAMRHPEDRLAYAKTLVYSGLQRNETMTATAIANLGSESLQIQFLTELATNSARKSLSVLPGAEPMENRLQRVLGSTRLDDHAKAEIMQTYRSALAQP